jgi:hypothetical protein
MENKSIFIGFEVDWKKYMFYVYLVNNTSMHFEKVKMLQAELLRMTTRLLKQAEL